MQVSTKLQNLIKNPNNISEIRMLAESTGKYAGQVGPFWCAKDGIWTEVWLQNDSPVAAKVGILRQDFKEPIYTTARMSSFFQTDGELSEIKCPDIMIANIAEALAFNRAFPSEMSEIHLTYEKVTKSDTSHESDGNKLQDISGEPITEPKVDPAEKSEESTAEPSTEPSIELTPATLSTDQVKRIQTLLNEVGSDGKKLLNHFSCEKLEELPTTAFEEIIKALEAKKAEISNTAKSKVEGKNSTKAGNSANLTLNLKQIENIRKMMTDTNTDENKFLEQLKEKSMDMIPAKRYGEIIGLLEAKRKAIANQSQSQSKLETSVATGNEDKRTINDTISMLAVKNIELRLSTDGTIIYAKSFSEKDFLKQIGFKWDATENAWSWTE